MKLSKLWTVFVICVPAVSIACSPEVATQSGSADLDHIPDANLTLLQTIGSVSDPDRGLTSVTSAAYDRDVGIVVFDLGGHWVKVYSAETGALLHRFGGRGDGPSEFRGVPTIQLYSDTIWVTAPSMARWSMFFPTGDLIDSQRLPPPDPTAEVIPFFVGEPPLPGGVLRPVPMGPNGDRLITGYQLDMGGWLRAPAPSEQPIEVAIPRMSVPRGSASPADSVGVLHLTFGVPRVLRLVSAAGLTAYVPVPTTQTSVIEPTRTGSVVVSWNGATPNRDSLWIEMRSLQDSVKSSFGYSYSPKAYTPTLLDSIVAESDGYHFKFGSALIAPNLGNHPDPLPAQRRALMTARREAMRFPEEQPPVRAIKTYGGGTAVWLLRERRVDGAERWLVVEPPGVPRASILLPLDSQLLWGSTNRVLVKRTDSLGVEWVDFYSY